MFLQKLKAVKALIFDVDGVLTNGDIIASDSGEFLRTFNIKDGYALQLAVKRGYLVCVISGGKGIAMQKRFEGLGLQEIHLGIGDKVAVFHQLLQKHGLDALEVLYMGDDIPDLKVMQLVVFPTCPSDAVPEIMALAQYVSPYTGGKTAVRDVIEKVMRIQGNWYDEQPLAADSGI